MKLLAIEDGWVTGDVERHSTDSHYPEVIRPVWIGIDEDVRHAAEAIVLHFTTSWWDTSLKTLSTSKGKSVQFLAGRDGKLAQLVRTDRGAYHVRDDATFEGKNIWNMRTLGIEMENLGPVVPDGNGGYNVWNGSTPWPVEPGEVLDFPSHGVEVTTADGPVITTHWHLYSALQLQAVVDLCVFLKSELGVNRLLGHSQIQDGKLDPGPAIMLESMAENFREGTWRTQNR